MIYLYYDLFAFSSEAFWCVGPLVFGYFCSQCHFNSCSKKIKFCSERPKRVPLFTFSTFDVYEIQDASFVKTSLIGCKLKFCNSWTNEQLCCISLMVTTWLLLTFWYYTVRVVHRCVVRQCKRHGTYGSNGCMLCLHVCAHVCTRVCTRVGLSTCMSNRPVIERRHAQIELHALLLLSRVISLANSQDYYCITNPAHTSGSNASTISAQMGASLTSSMIALLSTAK